MVQGDKYLVCKRPQGKRHGGLWEFPGGKVDLGESFSDAVQRELKEELELSVIAASQPLFKNQDPGSQFVVHFLPVTINSVPVLREHEELMWATIQELLSMPLAPTDQKFVEFLGERDGFPV